MTNLLSWYTGKLQDSKLCSSDCGSSCIMISFPQNTHNRHLIDSKVPGGQHGAHLGPTGPRWAPCWPYGLCYMGSTIRMRCVMSIASLKSYLCGLHHCHISTVAHISQCTSLISHNALFFYRNVHTQNDASWDICLMHCGIFEMGLLLWVFGRLF